MASGNDMKAANETYGGFIGLVKYGSVVVVVVAAIVIALITR
ncbi:aa3-type cytochrome c oxidase subunit IV [Novosphingobium sp. APW14]|nr:aa3-type cytochrome c oxidase subunit IV [Novosphingobium sp. APW14]MDT9011975.1 aa3-type cytochrome c oxidase subunit IV [Novosphingobium sp. APW14]